MMSVFPGLYPPRGGKNEFVGTTRILSNIGVNGYRTTRFDPPLSKLAPNDAAALAVASW
jgi:hypothetical protein